MHKFFTLTPAVCLFMTTLFAQKTPHPQAWFTGPLLTPSGHVIPEGHQNYEPYLCFLNTQKRYDQTGHQKTASSSKQFLTQASMQIGALPYTEFDVTLQWLHNDVSGAQLWRIGDIPLAFGFQLLTNVINSFQPAVKLRLGLNLPLGKYDELNLKALGTDVGGTGNFSPEIGLVFSNMYQFASGKYLAWRAFLSYTFSTSTDVKGASIYSDNITTDGKVRVGSGFTASTGAEYQLTQQIVLACDLQYDYTAKTQFSKKTTPAGLKGSPSNNLFSIAPAFEYNWNENVGMIFGPQIPLTGRNTAATVNYMFALNFYH